jgi:hypothetical protein
VWIASSVLATRADRVLSALKTDFRQVELFKVENARPPFFNIQHSEFT